MIPNKNFRFFKFLELFKNFRRGLTNYFFLNIVQEPVFNRLHSLRPLSIAKAASTLEQKHSQDRARRGMLSNVDV